MMRRVLAFASMSVVLAASIVVAQQAPPSQGSQPAPAAQATPAAPRPARPAVPADVRGPMSIVVTDASGAPQGGVHVSASGPVTRGGSTVGDGTLKFQGVRSGTYRLRFEADGFITLERDVTVKAGAQPPIDVALDRAPAKPPEPPPAPRPAANAGALPPADPNATVDVVSVVQWLAKNRLERGEPRRESEVLRSALAGASVLQLRDIAGDRGHADADEVLYVINGTASLTSKGRQQTIDTGTVLIVPRGVKYTLENRGKEPIWILSVLTPPGPGKPKP